MTFDNYQDFLKYTYNSLHAEGKIVEVIELVKSQTKEKPFDYDYCTVEGRAQIFISSKKTCFSF